jgi:hypothetical protein
MGLRRAYLRAGPYGCRLRRSRSTPPPAVRASAPAPPRRQGPAEWWAACEREVARPVIEGDSGSIGGNAFAMLKAKAVVRDHRDWDDESVAEAAGLHLPREAWLIDLARNEVRADDAIPDDAAWIAWGGAEAPSGAAG